MKMIKPVGSPLQFKTMSEVNEPAAIVPNFSMAKFKVESPALPIFATVTGRQVPVCPGEVLMAPLPGVPWLPTKPIK